MLEDDKSIEKVGQELVKVPNIVVNAQSEISPMREVGPGTFVRDPVNSHVRVVVSTPEVDAKKAFQIANAQKMIAAKEVKVLSAKKEAIEQGNINEIDLKMLLTKDDQEFYQEKKMQYLEAYPDLGSDPFDMDDLHLMIMEQIMQRTMLRRKKLRHTVDISKEYAESVKRQAEAKRSLSMRRTDRVKQKEGKKQTLNIANLSVQFNDPENAKQMIARLAKFRDEETLLDDPEKITE